MPDPISNLLSILDLEQLEHNLYRGTSPQVGWQRVFGGLVISQALVAASRTVDAERRVHSLHGYFLRPGDPSVPIIYEVDRLRDGKSFATRRAIAIQHGQPIFSLSCSYHRYEEGWSHQSTMPEVPKPDQLPSDIELKERFLALMPKSVRDYWERERPIELRPVDLTRYVARIPQEPRQYIWIRAAGKLPEDPAVHEAVLAYASDMTLLDTTLVAHGKSVFDTDVQAASIDHALWFHAPFKMDEWLLYAQESPFTGAARGFARGQIWQAGKLIASVAQEGLVRPRWDKDTSLGNVSR
ncbi:acyl-CoA thioesterase II [Labrys miyagiensis]|uniref:Acyl-CoA thioesterase II n=1 Tax=Labrys miyagiensis TaxID=346912 RepID=A0ABQ6CQD8_9HYPH|nr:acyl-CoA thioesterase II [Labrys miyagiensis]GLS21832.1 acyl-CoA thioesterase II [Labrys miyagiensis]